MRTRSELHISFYYILMGDLQELHASALFLMLQCGATTTVDGDIFQFEYVKFMIALFLLPVACWNKPLESVLFIQEHWSLMTIMVVIDSNE